MSQTIAVSGAASGASPRRRVSPFGFALLLALGAFAVQAAGGFPRLTDAGGDNDSLLRLVQVRDLMTGQGWFDLTQLRLGPDGLLMHWSRLVDLPIALLIGLFGLLPVPPQMAEWAAMVAWPFLLLVAALWLLIRAAVLLGGEDAMLPAGILGVIAMYHVGLFAAGVLDHHNVQLVLVLAVLALLAGEPTRRAGLVAGVAAALMLAVGMETLPLLAVAGVVVALRFWWAGRSEAPFAAGFGLGLGGTALLILVATVRPSEWFAPACDAFSIAQAASAAVAGLGLAAATLAPLSASRMARTFSLVVLGLAVVALAVTFFPGCLADPYAGLDPRLQRYWLRAVGEAQPFWRVLRSNQAQAAAFYVTPVIGLGVSAWMFRRHGASRALVAASALLAAAFLLSLWQVRGGNFAVPLAAVPLAAWVALYRRRAAARPSAKTSLAMVGAWLVSVNVAWGLLAAFTIDSGGDAQAAPGEQCTSASAFAALAGLPPATVLAVSNIGSPILAYTGHRVLAGPYHRNVAGNLLVLDAMMGDADAAHAIVRDRHVAYVAHCPGDPESALLSEWAPGGFIDGLQKGIVRDWLEAMPPAAGAPLLLYRVVER